jgi:hypothetical protein
MTTFDEELNIINSIDIFEIYYFNCKFCGEQCESYNLHNRYCEYCYLDHNLYYSDPYYSDCPMCGEQFNNSDCNVCGPCENSTFISCILCKCEDIDDGEYNDDDLKYIYNSEYKINYTCNKCFNKNFKLIDNELIPSNYITRYIMIISIIQRWWKDIYYHPDNNLAKELSKNFIKDLAQKIKP